MTPHELLLKANRYLIQGGTLTDAQKADIVRTLLAARSTPAVIYSFKRGVSAPEYLFAFGKSTDTRVMYPLFYIPPYNGGKKLQTVVPMSPKTHILSANAYELEILRLLYSFAPDNAVVCDMVYQTQARLKTTCFAYQDCHDGECFHTALIALRFLAGTSDDIVWMQRLCAFFNRYNGEVKRHSGTLWYYWLCLSELPELIALPEIKCFQPEMLLWLEKKSCVMHSDNDREIHPVLLCILRNCLSRFPEYEYIKNRQPYVSEKDGRLHFPMGAML